MRRPPALRIYVVTWAALMALLVATFAIAHWPLGIWNSVSSLTIAAIKMALVALVFMHLKRASTLLVMFAGIALVWLALLFGLSGTDYATRAVSPAPWNASGAGEPPNRTAR